MTVVHPGENGIPSFFSLKTLKRPTNRHDDRNSSTSSALPLFAIEKSAAQKVSKKKSKSVVSRNSCIDDWLVKKPPPTKEAASYRGDVTRINAAFKSDEDEVKIIDSLPSNPLDCSNKNQQNFQRRSRESSNIQQSLASTRDQVAFSHELSVSEKRIESPARKVYIRMLPKPDPIDLTFLSSSEDEDSNIRIIANRTKCTEESLTFPARHEVSSKFSKNSPNSIEINPKNLGNAENNATKIREGHRQPVKRSPLQEKVVSPAKSWPKKTPLLPMKSAKKCPPKSKSVEIINVDGDDSLSDSSENSISLSGTYDQISNKVARMTANVPTNCREPLLYKDDVGDHEDSDSSSSGEFWSLTLTNHKSFSKKHRRKRKSPQIKPAISAKKDKSVESTNSSLFSKFLFKPKNQAPPPTHAAYASSNSSCHANASRKSATLSIDSPSTASASKSPFPRNKEKSSDANNMNAGLGQDSELRNLKPSVPDDLIPLNDVAPSISGQDSPYYSCEEFVRMVEEDVCEADSGMSLHEFEKSKMVRDANKKIAAKDTDNQEKAQYGRILWGATDKLFREILDLKPYDRFLDIGHGIGNCVLQAAYTIGCDARGIEVVEDRNVVAVFLQSSLQTLRENIHNGRDGRNVPVGHVEFMLGALEDEKNREFLVEPPPSYYDSNSERRGGTKVFVNNFNAVFEKSSKSGQKYHLDMYVAGLFALMCPGSIMVTLHPLDMMPPQSYIKSLRNRHASLKKTTNENACFYEVEDLELDEASKVVSWSEGGSNKNMIKTWKYIRLPQESNTAVFQCCNPGCKKAKRGDPNSAIEELVLKDGSKRIILNTSCTDCGYVPKNLRRRRGQTNYGMESFEYFDEQIIHGDE